eukprot:gene8623-570_t
MSSTLYHYPGSRSSRVAWFFYELEATGLNLDDIVKINYVDLTKGEHKTEEYLKLNQFGTIPTFINEKGTFYEGCSILMQLSSQYQNIIDLVPKNKGKYYQWMSFACSSVDDLVVSLYFHHLKKDSEEVTKPKIEKLKPKFDFLSESLGKNDFFVDNKFSTVDIALGYILSVAAKSELLNDFPSLLTYVGRLSKREALPKAFSPIPSPEVVQLQQQLKEAKKEKESLQGAPITLYHYPGARSTRVLWVFYELGMKKDVDFKIVSLADKDVGWKFMQTDEYKKINPNSLIPAITLENGNANMFEAGTIINFFEKKYSHKVNLFPKSWNQSNWEKHYLYEFWCITTMDSKLVYSLWGIGKITNYLTGGVQTWWSKILEPRLVVDLSDHQYLQGNEFTATDFMMGYTLTFIQHNGLMKKADQKIIDYYKRISSRPAFVEAMQGSIFQWELKG